METVNIVIMAMSSEGGGQIVAKTTSDLKILERCNDEHESLFFNETSSPVFYCISESNLGFIIQQIRRTESGRRGTYNSFCILIPKGKIIEMPIVPIFDEIYNIYATTEGNKRDNALLDVANKIALVPYSYIGTMGNNSSFAYRIVDDNTIEEVLHNPMQAVYTQFKYIILVHEDDKICLSTENKITAPIEHIEKYSVPQQVVHEITFTPIPQELVGYPSQIKNIHIIYKANGYEDVELEYGEQISINDIAITIKKSRIKVEPSNSKISCNVGEDTGDTFIIPLNLANRASFTISKEGYLSKKDVKLSDIQTEQTIHLSPQKKEATLTLYSDNSQSKQKVNISYISKDFPSDFSPYNYALYPKRMIDHLNSVKRKYIIKTILSAVVALFFGIGAGIAIDRFVLKAKPTKSGWHIKAENPTQQPSETEMEQNYLASDEWMKNGNPSRDMKEPNGLFQAMNTFSYPDIKVKYEAYKKKKYNVGKLQEVMEIINKYDDDIKTPKANYTDLTKDAHIKISKWIELVENENKSQPTTGASTGSKKSSGGGTSKKPDTTSTSAKTGTVSD